MSFCFGFRRPKGVSTLRHFNAQGGEAAPPPRFSPAVKTLVRRKSTAGQLTKRTHFPIPFLSNQTRGICQADAARFSQCPINYPWAFSSLARKEMFRGVFIPSNWTTWAPRSKSTSNTVPSPKAACRTRCPAAKSAVPFSSVRYF